MRFSVSLNVVGYFHDGLIKSVHTMYKTKPLKVTV